MTISSGENGLTLVLTARVPASGIAQFQAYEAKVLPLLAEHGGTLERRLRSADGTFEMHILHFKTRSGFESFRNDPRRHALSLLLSSSGAVFELTEVHAVE